MPYLGGDLTTLLAVDDSKTMRKVLEITFAGENFDTRIAATTHEAFTQLAEQNISVALVDITLGEQSGYDVCKRIKAEFPAVQVLLLSSKQNPYDAARGVSSGADDHLDKPFDTQVLLDKVRALVSRAEAQPAVAATPPVETVDTSVEKPTAHVGAPETTSDSKIPTAMPEAPDEELLEDEEGPLLIPIEEDELLQPEDVADSESPSMPTAAPAAPSEPPAPAQQPVRTVVAQPVEHTLPTTAVAGAAAALAPLESKLGALGLTAEQVSAVLALSREVVEAAVWEVVPTLAETLIKEEIRRLTQ